MPAEKKRDWGPGEGEMMDYDTLLAHYRETLEPEDPAPAHQRDKKKRTLALISQLSEEGKFSRKRGSKTPAASPTRENPQEEARKAATEEARRTAQEAIAKKAAQRAAAEAARESLPIRLVKTPSRPAALAPEPQESGKPMKTPPIHLTEKAREAEKTTPVPPDPETRRDSRTAPERLHPEKAQAESVPPPVETPALPEEPEEKKERKGLFSLFKRKGKEPEDIPGEAAEPALSASAAEESEGSLPAEHHRVAGVLEWLYIEVYYIGIQLMRDMNLLHRRWMRFTAWAGENIPQWAAAQHHRFLRLCNRISDTTLFPYREIARLTSRLVRRIKSAGHEKGSFKAKLGHWWDYFRSLSRPLNHIANFAAPIVGITILAATLTWFRGVHYALSVEYNGRHLGYIAEENVFYEAQQTVTDRMMGAENLASGVSQPSFRIVIANEEDLADPETLANRILSVSQIDVQEADGVYIEGAFLGAMENGREFLIYLDSILENYRTGIDHELVQFVKSVTLRRGIYPINSVLPLDRITQEMQSDQTRLVEHKVAEGEDLPAIAAAYEITTDELLELNPILQERQHEVNEETGEIDPATISLLNGERLTVARVTMDLGVQVTRREVYSETIPYGTTSIEDSRYYKGYQVPISAGINGSQEVTADVTYIDGEKVGETRIGTPVVTREPVNARVVVGTMPILTYLDPTSSGSNSYLWPVKGGYVSAGLYGYAGHTGMDIAAPAGTEIRAARDGQVTYAVNYSIWPFGKSVVISHGDGAITRYAHCSSVFVTPGQYVHQGDLIALVGRTGNATGNHCHFEIRINGAVMNPANFVGNRYPGF